MAWLTLLGMAFWIIAPRAQAQPKGEPHDTHPFAVQDLVALDRLSGMVLSPDRKSLAYVLRTTDMEANRGRTDIWVMDVDGNDVRRMTTDPASDHSPFWSRDGESLYFLSTRSGSSQLWNISLAGGEARQVTDLPLDVSSPKLSPDGNQIAFAMEVFVDCETMECTEERLEERAAQKTTGRAYDQLLFRHWDVWEDGRRFHIFVAPISGAQLMGDPVDIMGSMNADAPTKPWGGAEEYTFTPDGLGIVFTAKDVGREEAWSTDYDLFVAPVDGSRAPQCITEENDAWDTQPVFSPDGTTLAHLAMRVPGYEADRLRIVLRSWTTIDEDETANWQVGSAQWLSEEWDRSPHSLSWTVNGRRLLAHAAHFGRDALFMIDARNGDAKALVNEGSVKSEVDADGRIYLTMDHFQSPVQIYSVEPDGDNLRQISQINAEKLARVRMGEPEQFSFSGANGDVVYGWLVRPVDFDPARSYPVAFLVHGGPQGSFGTDFHYRWNPQTYAGAGYAAIMIDFHGSTGYGQEFCDSIQDNWGGWPLEDLQKGLNYALETYPWLDGDRVAALGASYGGYMINWIAWNWPDRFRCLVNHDGLFDKRFSYYDTEELWFPEREMKGTPWENPDSYDRWDPANHVDKWQTPLLVIHGALDYRVPYAQGLAAFTAAQRRGVPSRLLFFPDENHWVLKPHNSIQWHEEVLAWLDRWTKEP
jgi:dipeptidyl aminopeptidase/acylaminoacyl peptidase